MAFCIHNGEHDSSQALEVPVRALPGWQVFCSLPAQECSVSSGAALASPPQPDELLRGSGVVVAECARSVL